MFNRKFSIKSCICVNFRLTHQHTTTQIWLKKKKKLRIEIQGPSTRYKFKKNVCC